MYPRITGPVLYEFRWRRARRALPLLALFLLVVLVRVVLVLQRVYLCRGVMHSVLFTIHALCRMVVIARVLRWSRPSAPLL